jgi:large subunit ribosomal protein L9
MQVILMEKIGRLGNLGDQVKVKPGFARNFLIPKGKAIPATQENVAVFEKRRAELEKAAAETLKSAQARAQSLTGMVVNIAARAADEGRLYGSIGTREIAEAISKAGAKVEKSEISLPTGPLRQIGEQEIHVHLHSDVHTVVKINVIAEA